MLGSLGFGPLGFRLLGLGLLRFGAERLDLLRRGLLGHDYLRFGFARLARDADALDLPFQRDAGLLQHPLAHEFAQCLDVGGRGLAGVDEEVAMLLGHLRTAKAETAAAGLLDQFPGLEAGGIGEGAAAGPAADRLARLSRVLDLLQLGADRGRIPRLSLEQRSQEDPVLRDRRVAIGKAEGLVAEAMA